MSAAEARALASGDPRAVELVTLETQLAGMKLDRSAYESQRANAQSQIGTLTNRVDVLSKQLPNYERDAAVAAQVLANDSFVASDSEGKAFDKRADADKAFRDRLVKTPFGGELDLGTYKGFKLHGANKDTGYQVVLESVGTGQKYSSNSFDNPATANVITRADNIIKGMVSAHEDKKGQLAGAQESLRSYKAQVDKPYDQGQELMALERKARDLRQAVQGIDESQEGEAVEFSEGQLIHEDIQQASDEDMIDAEQRVLAQIMERRREDRAYQTPTGGAFDGLVSESLQDILQERRQQEEAGIDAHVDADLMEKVPDAISDNLKEKAAAAIADAFDIDPGRFNEIVGTAQKEDLSPAETGEVVERVAERIQEEAEDNQAEGRKVTVISLSDVDAMLQEEMKDQGIEEGVIPQHSDTDYGEEEDEDTTTSPAPAPAYAAQDDADEEDAELDADDGEEDPGYLDAMDDLERADAVVEEEEEQTTQPSNRRLVTEPMDEDLGVDLSDPVERGLMAGDALDAMSPEVRNTHDVLADRLGDLLDEYELTILARRLGENPTEEQLEQEEARLRRQGALNQGQVDMFGATADEPDAMAVPEPLIEPEASPAQPEPMPEPLPPLASTKRKLIPIRTADGGVTYVMAEPEPESSDMAGQAEVGEETLADRIRNVGDTGFVDPDDYERVMDAHFDGDIAEVDNLEDLETHVEREPATTGGMTEEAQEELAGYESAPTPSQQESLAMTEEDIERLGQYDSASMEQDEEPEDSPNEYSVGFADEGEYQDLRQQVAMGASEKGRLAGLPEDDRIEMAIGIMKDAMPSSITKLVDMSPAEISAMHQNVDCIVAENNAEIERRKMQGMESVGDMTDLAAVEAELQSVGLEYQEAHSKQDKLEDVREDQDMPALAEAELAPVAAATPPPEPETADPDPALTPVAEVKEADTETSRELASICRDYGDKTPEDLERDIDSLHSRLDTLEKKTGLGLDKLPANAVKLELNDDGSVSVQTAPITVESDQSATEKERQERQPAMIGSTADTPPPSEPRQQQPRREREGGLPASDDTQATDWDSLSMAQKRRAVKEVNAVLERLAIARALRVEVQQGSSLSEAVDRYCALLTRPLAALSMRLSSILGRSRGQLPGKPGGGIAPTQKTGLRGRRAPKQKERDWAAEAAGRSEALPTPVIYVK